MFERYTEQARRSIFFARYEASQYGSPKIETEHLLLGILREDKRLARVLFDEIGACESIRKEIETQTTRGDRISTSVEMPLTMESKRILNFAADSAEKLEHRHVDTVHLILGILREEGCFAARILESRRVDSAKIRKKIEERKSHSGSSPVDIRDVATSESRRAELQAIAERLVESWAIRDVSGFFGLFAPSGHFWDSHGKCWSGVSLRQGIDAQFEAHRVEVKQVVLEQVFRVALKGAVVTLRLTSTNESSQLLVAVLQDIGGAWQIVSAHLSLIEAS